MGSGWPKKYLYNLCKFHAHRLEFSMGWRMIIIAQSQSSAKGKSIKKWAGNSIDPGRWWSGSERRKKTLFHWICRIIFGLKSKLTWSTHIFVCECVGRVCLVLVVFPAHHKHFAPTPNPVAQAGPKSETKTRWTGGKKKAKRKNKGKSLKKKTFIFIFTTKPDLLK